MRSSIAIGRIVLELSPDINSPNGFPEVALKDGDALVVPSKMSEVHLFGEVYNQQSTIWKPGETVLDALTSAGGPTKHASLKTMFIIRADGSVYSKEMAGRKFTSIRLSPGDTVVVPEEIEYPSGLPELKEWAQIFGQFALGIAAMTMVLN